MLQSDKYHKHLLVVVADVVVAAGTIARVGVVEAPAVANVDQLVSSAAPESKNLNLPFIDHVVGVSPAFVAVPATALAYVANVYG